MFIAQVIAGASAVPNFWPAMKITFGASGRRATASGSSRSQRIVSTPASFSARSAAADDQRETAITRRESLRARAAMRASVGPILPPAPRMMMSPGHDSSAAVVSGRGVERRSSSSCSVILMSNLRSSGNIGNRSGHAPHQPLSSRVWRSQFFSAVFSVVLA